jgi:hypothetical protein
VELDGFVFKRPPVILELLVGGFAELSQDTGRLVFKDQSATDEFLMLALRGLDITLDPI